MKTYYVLMFVLFSMFFASCASNSANSNDPDLPSNAYLDGEGSEVGLILCHAKGQYPTWDVVKETIEKV